MSQSTTDPRLRRGHESVYRWNPSEARWQVWNGVRWVRSMFYDAVGENNPLLRPRLTMTYEETINDLQEIA